MSYQHEHTIEVLVGSTYLDAVVTYTITPGWKGDWTDPGYPAEAEIVSVELVHDEPANPFTGRKRHVRHEAAGKLLTDLIKADAEVAAELIEAAGEVA